MSTGLPTVHTHGHTCSNFPCCSEPGAVTDAIVSYRRALGPFPQPKPLWIRLTTAVLCVCVFAREVESSEYSIAFVAGCLETDQIGWSAVGMQRLTGFTINRALKSHG